MISFSHIFKKAKKFISKYRNQLLLSAIAVLLAFPAYKVINSTNENTVDKNKLQQIGQAQITKNCLEEMNKKRVELNCKLLERGRLEQLEGGLFDGGEFSTGSGVKDTAGELIWWSTVRLDAKGKILFSEVSYRNQENGEMVSETNISNY